VQARAEQPVAAERPRVRMAQQRASQRSEVQQGAEAQGRSTRPQEPEVRPEAWPAALVPEAQLQASPLLEARPGAPVAEPPQLLSFE